jgi:hypothetical protein
MDSYYARPFQSSSGTEAEQQILKLDPMLWPDEQRNPALLGFQSSLCSVSAQVLEAGCVIAGCVKPSLAEILEASTSHVVRLINYHPSTSGMLAASQQTSQYREWHTDFSLLTAVSAPR